MYSNFRLDPLGEITRYPCSLAGMARECYSRQPSRSWGALQREGDRGDWGNGNEFCRSHPSLSLSIPFGPLPVPFPSIPAAESLICL